MTTSSKRQASTAYPAVPKDTLLSISKKTITPFPGLPSLLDVASEIFSKDPIQPENYQRFNSTLDAGDVFLTTYGATIRQQKPVQKKRYIIPKSPFSASGFASNGNEKVWFYIDEQENNQGPFSSSDMDSWFDGGYFFNELLIRFKDQGEFRKLSEMLGKQQEYQQYQQQQQNYSNDAPQRGFGIARNNSGSNQQQGRNFESKDKFERRTEDKPAAQGGMFARAKKEEVPLQLSPTEAPKQSSEEKVETKAAEKPQEKSPEIKQEAPVVQKEEIPEAQPEKEVEVPAQEEEVQEEEPEVVDVKKQQAPVDFDDSEWVSIKKTKNKKKGKGNAPAKPEPVRVEPPKPVVKAQTATPQKPVEQEKSPKKEEPAKEEEKVVEPKPVEAKVEPPKPLGVSYPFNQNIAPIVGGAKAKKGKTKIIANWLDEDAEEVAVQKELERPTNEKLSSVVDFPSLGGSLVPEKKEPAKAGSKNKNTKEDQQLKQDLLSIQQQQQREEEERKHQMRIKQEEERERKLKQQRDEQAAAEAKPVKKEVPAVTEEEFPSLGMGAKVQEKPAPKKKPATQAAPAKKEEKPVAAPKQKASPVKASNNPKYAEDFPAL